MNRVVAAIANDTAAGPVLDIAKLLGRLLHDPVTAVHVAEDGAGTVDAIASAAGVDVETLQGDPVRAILERFSAPDVALGVIGARATPAGRRPTGATAFAVATGARSPVVLVPPDVEGRTGDDGRRVLVPLDGSLAASAAARSAQELFSDANLEIVLLHVFDGGTLPRFWDQPHHAAESWGREFAGRHLPRGGARVALRTGPPAERVLDLARSEAVDFIALSWAQNTAADRARTLREVLGRSSLPVILFPSSEPDGIESS